MEIRELTEQCLDVIAEKQGKIWNDNQRKKFSEVVAEVKAYNPPSPWICEREQQPKKETK